MPNLTSTLTIKLIDDVSAPAKAITRALAEAEARAKALANSGASGRLQQRLSALGASAAEINRVFGRLEAVCRGGEPGRQRVAVDEDPDRAGAHLGELRRCVAAQCSARTAGELAGAGSGARAGLA